MTIVMQSKIISSVKKTCCDNKSSIITNRGEIVCKNCGACFGSSIISSSKRIYNKIDMEKKQTHEIKSTISFGSRTVFTPNTDWNGSKISAKRKKKFRHLLNINRSIISSNERNYITAFPYLKKIGNKLGLPKHVINLAWKIYKKGQEKKLVAGRSIKAAVSSSLYISSRFEKVTRVSDDFLNNEFTRKDFNKANQLFVRIILKDMGMKFKPITPQELVPYLANKVNYSSIKGVGLFHENIKIETEVQIKAIVLITKAINNGMIKNGKDPRGIAGAGIYIICKSIGKIMTQNIIATACMITEVTLRARIKEINIALGRDYLLKSFNLEKK